MNWRGLYVEVTMVLGRLRSTKPDQHADVLEAALTRAYWNGMRRAAERIESRATQRQDLAVDAVSAARVAGMWDAADNIRTLLKELDT